MNSKHDEYLNDERVVLCISRVYVSVRVQTSKVSKFIQTTKDTRHLKGSFIKNRVIFIIYIIVNFIDPFSPYMP